MKVKHAGKDTSRPRRPGRKSPPPPAILHGPDENLYGVHILDDVPSEVGMLLWQSLRDVVLWSSVPAGGRAGLFRPESVRRTLASLMALGTDPVLNRALTSLSALTVEPEAARPESVCGVCLQVARWAEDRGWLATALAFAQGAALAAPADAAAGLMVGNLARRRGERARAETWLRRTLVLGRRNGDRMTLIQACLALGEMQEEKGEVEAARALFLRAFRGARRSGFRELKGQALHGLFRLAAKGGHFDQADAYGRSALHAYGRRNPRVSKVARDVGSCWMERGKYAEALSALRLLLPHARHPAERVEALAAVARAAAAAGSDAVFEQAAREALLLLGRTRPEDMPSLPEWWDAYQLAKDVVVPPGEDPTSTRFEALLTAVWTHSGGMPVYAVPTPA